MVPSVSSSPDHLWVGSCIHLSKPPRPHFHSCCRPQGHLLPLSLAVPSNPSAEGPARGLTPSSLIWGHFVLWDIRDPQSLPRPRGEGGAHPVISVVFLPCSPWHRDRSASPALVQINRNTEPVSHLPGTVCMKDSTGPLHWL